jgi:integrase
MPNALRKKYPRAGVSLGWQYLFPSANFSFQTGTRLLRRHHIDESGINRTIKTAAQRAEIGKQVTSHTLCHYAELGINATLLLTIFWSRVLISERFKSNWGIRM